MFLFAMFHPILILMAVVPAIILMVYVYKADKLEKESPRLIKNLVLWGILSTALAACTEYLGELILSNIMPMENKAYDFILYFVIVGLSEEGFKYLVLKKRTWKNKEFNCQFDGVVYAVFVSLGFALWENIKYVFTYGFGTALVRAVTAVPGHACFGVFMGVWYGLAKWMSKHGRRAESKTCRILAVIIPTLIHGCYDYLATRTDEKYSWIFLIFIAAMFAVAFLLVKKCSEKDRYLVDVGYVDKFGNFIEIDTEDED